MIAFVLVLGIFCLSNTVTFYRWCWTDQDRFPQVDSFDIGGFSCALGAALLLGLSLLLIAGAFLLSIPCSVGIAYALSILINAIARERT